MKTYVFSKNLIFNIFYDFFKEDKLSLARNQIWAEEVFLVTLYSYDQIAHYNLSLCVGSVELMSK